jgi:hypothetical protein
MLDRDVGGSGVRWFCGAMTRIPLGAVELACVPAPI